MASVTVKAEGPSKGIHGLGPQNEETEFHLCGTPYPVVSSVKALMILILNAGSPGVGTCVIGCLGKDNVNCYHFICMGVIQMLLTQLCCVGLIWALCATCKFKELSDTYESTGVAPAANLALSLPHEAISFRTIQSSN